MPIPGPGGSRTIVNTVPGSTPTLSNTPQPGKSPVKTLDTSAVLTHPGTLSSVASDVPWHHVVLWFLGAVAMLALADPAPQIATGIMVILILGTLLNNWPVYKTYLGLK